MLKIIKNIYKVLKQRKREPSVGENNGCKAVSQKNRTQIGCENLKQVI